VDDIAVAASRAAAALQQWYGADPYARRTGLYSYRDPSLAVQRRPVTPAQAGLELRNAALAAIGQRHRMADTARWWNTANAVTAIIGYMSVTGDRSYLAAVVRNTFTRAQRVCRPVAPPRLAVGRPFLGLRPACYSGFCNGFYDDEGWWALAWIAAYDLTGEPGYLAAADEIVRDMTGGWDEVWGGGIYWGKHDGQPDRAGVTAVPRSWRGTYKNAIANELLIAAAAALGVRYRDQEPGGSRHAGYRDWALRALTWFSSPPPGGVSLVNSDHLINDSPNRRGVNDDSQSIWSYNQGVILGGLADLAELTGDGSYLGRAAQIADAFIAAPWRGSPGAARGPGGARPPRQSGVIDGILHEHNECAADGSGPPPGGVPGVDSTLFKGIFVRNLARLYRRTGRPAYRDFIMTNARSALAHMNEACQFGSNWAAPVDVPDFVRQTAGLDLVNAALLVSGRGPAR